MNNSKSAPNALSHGVYTKQVVLPWEEEQKFKTLHEDLRKELFPDGASEESVVFDLAILHWKKLRLAVGSQLLLRQIPEAKALEAAAEGKGWEGIGDYLSSSVRRQDEMRDATRECEKEVSRAAGQIAKRMSDRALQIGSPPPTSGEEAGSSAQTTASKNARDQESKFASLEILHGGLHALLGEIRSLRKEAELYDCYEKLCERAYGPQHMEHSLKLEGEIDKRIEKKMVHLVRLKEYKRLYGTQRVTTPIETKDLVANGKPLQLEVPKGASSSNTVSATLAPK